MPPGTPFSPQSTGSTSQQQPQPLSRKKFFSIATALLIVIALAIYAFYLRSPRETPAPETAYSKQLPKLSEASLSKIPKGFPRYYIFGVNAVVEEGVTEELAGGRTRRAVTVRAEEHPQDLYNEYKEYFTATGWRIRSDQVAGLTAMLIAEKLPAQLTVSIVTDARTALVYLNYLTKDE